MNCNACDGFIPQTERYFAVYIRIDHDAYDPESYFTGYVWHIRCAPEDLRKATGIDAQ